MNRPSAPVIVDASGARVWRVGRAPDPWAWIDRQYAGHNRWDDHDRVFRTLYVGDSLYACYVEILAYARPDLGPGGTDLLAGIEEDPEDADMYPVPPAGVIPRDWIAVRMVGNATLHGRYADVRTAETIAALWPAFQQKARGLGFPDFDAAALKSAEPRELTQCVATYLYARTDTLGRTLVNGVRFASRHGDNLTMWAIFERPGDEPTSRNLRGWHARSIDVDDPDLARAMLLHRLKWR